MERVVNPWYDRFRLLLVLGTLAYVFLMVVWLWGYVSYVWNRWNNRKEEGAGTYIVPKTMPEDE